jgi:hypothetical protein
MLVLAHAVKAEFLTGTVQLGNNGLVLKGKLSLLPDSKAKANCTVIFTRDWKTKPPAAVCHDKWIRPKRNWHAAHGGLLCYVLSLEWAKELQGVAQRHFDSDVARYAATYLVRGLRYLLQRHMEGHQRGFKKWKWVGWAHGSDGHDEFAREQAVLESIRYEA